MAAERISIPPPNLRRLDAAECYKFGGPIQRFVLFEVLTQLLLPIAAALFVGLGMGWTIWRRGRSFMSRSEFEGLQRKALNADTNQNEAAADLLQRNNAMIAAERELAELRTHTASASQVNQHMQQELRLRDQKIAELLARMAAFDSEMRGLHARLNAASRDADHSATYIRALEAELQLSPAVSQ